MNAVSLEQLDAAALLAEDGPVEYPAWQTEHRGLLLIHAAKRKAGKDSPGQVCNAVIGVVDLADCVRDEHPGAHGCGGYPDGY